MSGSTPYEYMYINDLSGGLNVSDSPLAIAENELQTATNCIITSSGVITKREGYAQTSSHTIAGATYIQSIFRFYHTPVATTIVQDDNGKVYSYSSVTGYTEITGGLTLTANKLRYKDYKGWLFMYNGSQCQATNGDGTKADIIFKTDSEYLPTNRNVIHMEVCDDRLFFVFEDEPYSVYFSEYGGWDTGDSPISGDGILIKLSSYLNVPERSRDSAGITGLKSFGLTDELIIFMSNSTFVLLGVGASDYSLRKISGESGCCNADTIVESEDGTIYYMGNKKIYMMSGENIISIGDKVSSLFQGYSINTNFALYDSLRDLVYFVIANGTLVWNISRDEKTGKAIMGWTFFDYRPTAMERFSAVEDNNEIYLTISDDTKMYTVGGGSDDGEDILFEIKTKCFDMGAFAEKKQFRGIKTLQDCATNEPFTVTLILDDGIKTCEKLMVLPLFGVKWGETTWSGAIWTSSNRINGSIVMPDNLSGYEFEVSIVSEDQLSLRIHKLAVEFFARNRDRGKTTED